MHRRVAIVVFGGVQPLDAFGPVDVFATANWLNGGPGSMYDIELVAAETGPVRTASGPTICADRAISDPTLRPDVMLVAGGGESASAALDQSFVDEIRALAGRSATVGSICTGAFLLAAAGLLDGRRATTHWAAAAGLADRFPSVTVEHDRVFVNDGVWTSAGVTAGMDLALELLRIHHGRRVASAVARNMVMYVKRAGGQSQFSTHLAAQSAADPTMDDLLAWIADHLDEDLSVASLADRAAMSNRSFQRKFVEVTGTPPARFVESLRIDTARRMLEESGAGVAAIARDVGYQREETFMRAFSRRVGLNPGEYRMRFAMQPDSSPPGPGAAPPGPAEPEDAPRRSGP